MRLFASGKATPLEPHILIYCYLLQLWCKSEENCALLLWSAWIGVHPQLEPIACARKRYSMMIKRTEVEPQHRQNMCQGRRVKNKKPWLLMTPWGDIASFRWVKGKWVQALLALHWRRVSFLDTEKSNKSKISCLSFWCKCCWELCESQVIHTQCPSPP